MFIVSQVSSHRPPPHRTASSSPAQSSPLSEGEGERADGGRSCRNWTRVNVHGEGVCPNGGSSAGVKTKRGVSAQPGVFDTYCQGEKKCRKGLCKNEIVRSLDGDSERCRGLVSAESTLLLHLTHLCPALSRWSFRCIFFLVDLLFFLPGEQKNQLAEVPLDLGPRC